MDRAVQKGYPGLGVKWPAGIAYKNIRFYGQLSDAGQIRSGEDPKIEPTISKEDMANLCSNKELIE